MNLSNAIAQMISEMLEEKSEIEIRRNILAQDLGCVPSQINYVLSSRFTPERGYIVESRRGGGGCIKITRITFDKDSLLMDIVNSVGSALDEDTARAHIMNLAYHNVITNKEARLMLAATGDMNFRNVPPALRNVIRANILKQILLTAIKE